MSEGTSPSLITTQRHGGKTLLHVSQLLIARQPQLTSHIEGTLPRSQKMDPQGMVYVAVGYESEEISVIKLPDVTLSATYGGGQSAARIAVNTVGMLAGYQAWEQGKQDN